MLNTAKNQCWMLPTVCALIFGTGFSTASAFTSQWLIIECEDRHKVVFGLTECCSVNRTNDGGDRMRCEESIDSKGRIY